MPGSTTTNMIGRTRATVATVTLRQQTVHRFVQRARQEIARERTPATQEA